MKQNLTEMQYIQIAKETLTHALNKVPFVSDIEIENTGFQCGFGDFHAIVHFSDSDTSQDFFVEVKANGEKRFATMFMKEAQQLNNNACYLFMAPYISEATAEMLRNKNLSFMDLSGNCYILTRRIIFHVSGKPNQYIEKREKKNYLSKSSSAASTILRTMLDQPDRLWKVKELSDISGKAIGTVSNVKAFLIEKDWVNDQVHSFGLKNINELLHEWSKDYHKKDSIEKQFYSLDAIPELEKRISEWSFSHDKSAVLAGFSAAARYAPTVRYNKINVYVEEQSLFEFIKDLDLEQVQYGGNIVVIIPHDETPCMFNRVINDSVVSSPTQTVIDLLNLPNRGEEAANAIIEKMFNR